MSYPLTGLCLWAGPGSTITGDHASGVGWTNQVYPINGHLFADPGAGPQTGANTLDGHPLLTWRVDLDLTQRLQIDSVPATSTPTPMKKTNGSDFHSTAGSVDARTSFAVIVPAYDAASLGGMVGGTVASWCDDIVIETLFELSSDIDPNQFGVFTTRLDWGRGTSHYIKGPDTPGGPGSQYDGAPLFVEWAMKGTTIRLWINKVEMTLSSNVIDVTATTTGLEFIIGDRAQPGSGNKIFRWKGDLGEILVYDSFLIEDDPTTRSAVYNTAAPRWPSIGLPMPTLAISPKRAIVTPGGQVQFSADGASGTPVYSMVAGYNLSGATVDADTGLYVAGSLGPAEDRVRVTDDGFNTDDAFVSVTGTLYRDYQSKTPAGPQGPNLRIIERVHGGEKDIQFERARQAALVGLPGVGPFDDLDAIGEDRQLPRAVVEAPPDDGLSRDQAYSERLRTSWESVEGFTMGGGHEGLLRALDRAGFPQGILAGAVIIQRTRLYSYIGSGVPGVFDHAGAFDPNPAAPPWSWHHFMIVFGADFSPPIGTTFEDGDPSADLLNRLVRLWKPGKAHYVGAIVVVSGPSWGWPFGVTWGAGGRNWGGGSTRYISPG